MMWIVLVLLILLIGSAPSVWIKMMGVRMPHVILARHLVLVLFFQLLLLLGVFVAHEIALPFQLDREKRKSLEDNQVND